jgi:hypothetical protein
MLVDDRKNYLMFGLSTALITQFYHGLLYSLGLGVFLIAVGVIFRHYKVLGEGDINAILWILYGFGLMGWENIIVFTFIFSVIALAYTGLKLTMIKLFYKGENLKTVKTPFFAVILIVFTVSCWYMGVLI